MKEQRGVTLVMYVISLIIMAIVTGTIVFFLVNEENTNKVSNTEIGNLSTTETTKNTINTTNVVIDKAHNTFNEIEDDKNIVNDNTELKEEVKEDVAQNNLVLYKGCAISTESGKHAIGVSSFGYDKESKQKYNNVTYYNYENGKYQGTSTGNFVLAVGDEPNGLGIVENVGKIAMTKKYEVYPREYTVVYNLPEQLKYLEQYKENGNEIYVHSIDFDGDGANEYIAYYKDPNAIGWYYDESDTFSEMVIYDSKFNKIAEKTIKSGSIYAKENEKGFCSIDQVEYIDIDGDGIMEILLETPGYEGYAHLYIMKYQNGNLQGNVDLVVPIVPYAE